MNKKTISVLFLSILTLGASLTSCQDMLSPDSERHSYTIAQDTLYSYWGILRSLQNVGERYVILGECRGDLVSGTTHLSDTISNILNFDMEKASDGSSRYLQASDYYHIINSCNAYIANCDKKRVTGTLKPYMLKEYAQVIAIRAWTYLQLVQVYGEAPFYTTPLLTTDELNKFMNNPSHPTATADNLADMLAPELEELYAVELEYGFPQYDEYGRTTLICHSEKCMIPISLILGDLYLTKGDKQSCEKAAQWYYNYFSPKGPKNAGGTIPNGYSCYGYIFEGLDQPQYEKTGAPWTEKGAWSETTEAITAIPSSTNKLWGTVQRGVNELFGFASEIRANNGESSSKDSITLTPQYDVKQLRASDGYFAQCKAVPFEYYIATDANAVAGTDYTIEADYTVGDARRAWVQEYEQEYSNGTTNKELFITKQNPNGSFSTVFPMIYRKSMVWLRYAEAINRAGYPGYAFAILKNGLCNNKNWLPDPEKHYAQQEDGTWTNYCDQTKSANIICDYISRQERINSKDAPYLNFGTTHLEASSSYCNIMYCVSNNSDVINIAIYASKNSDSHITTGIHYHGAGLLKYDEKLSLFNYVDCITDIAKTNYNETLTKEQIYDEANQELVQQCVEDLIVDEEALELAFEGTRFFDLMRVAHRRAQPEYLATRVAKRNGQFDNALYTKLTNPRNWYFPLPQY